MDPGEGQGCRLPISEWGALSRPPSAALQPYPLALSPPEAANSTEGTGTYHTELHIAPAAKGAPPQVPKKSSRVLQMSKALNPDNLAPGKVLPADAHPTTEQTPGQDGLPVRRGDLACLSPGVLWCTAGSICSGSDLVYSHGGSR